MKYLYMILMFTFGFLDFLCLLLMFSSFTHGFYLLAVVFLVVSFFTDGFLFNCHRNYDEIKKKGE